MDGINEFTALLETLSKDIDIAEDNTHLEQCIEELIEELFCS